jgi:pimeloyl-ACP methyl ester carboxylesterase
MRSRVTAFFIVLALAILETGEAYTRRAVEIFPDTTEGIHVFNDQIDVQHLSDAQVSFAATHYAGSQKLTLSDARRLRAYDPNFIVLHYRLALGMGYRAADEECQPTGENLQIIRGDDWVQEWPGDAVVQENWFYHYQGQRVYSCAWGWYLLDTDHPAWRAWWMSQIMDQLAANEDDGLFADSVTIPNYLGTDSWHPPLPDYDEAFEADWTRRIQDWMAWVRGEFGSRYRLIVNAGMLVTTRETTDYSLADGVMVEGFAGWGEYERFEMGDWVLQMDRILALVSRDRVVILQSYVQDPQERLWTLANYLLVKGSHTYFNFETSQDVEWFPEYELPIGHPLPPPAATAQELQNEGGLFARAYSNGLVLINPDPSGSPLTQALAGPMVLVTGVTGGGGVPEDGLTAGWGVELAEIHTVTVAPGQAAILLGTLPDSLQSTPGPAEGAVSSATTVSTNAAVSAPAQLTAFHRSGQTFLTWPELPDGTTQTYRIYQHSTPFDAASLNQAQLVAEVPQGSGIFWTERARALEPPPEDKSYASLRNYVITDGGAQLPDGTGLFVWTTHEDGDFYYAVTAADGSILGVAGPVAERVSEPEPVLAWQSSSGLSRVYTQFMDHSTYNPTFDAPRVGNGWLGQPEELVADIPQQQYAYNYWVGLPTVENCGGTIPEQVPLILRLEGWGSRYAVPDAAEYWCAVMIWADDPSQSWYYGFSAVHDYRTESPVTAGPIVNYTEERLLSAVHDVLRTASQPAIDPNRIYVYGHSMGATGALALAERYPQMFAAATAGEPMTNFAAAAMWIDELEGKWGARSLNLPIENRGPDAAHLVPYNSTGVWDWQNLAEQLSARRGDEMAFIAIAHGTQDTVIDWQAVARPAYAYFYTGRRAFIGEIIDADHTWLGFREHPNWNFEAMSFRRDESIPALSNASGSMGIPPDGPGGYNLSLEWSSSGNDFAGLPIDTPDRWAIVLRSMAGNQTVDVTPRRLQQFKLVAGNAYTWQNVHLSDGAAIQGGTVVADADGLITITGFEVDEIGNQLVLEPS